MSSLQINHSPDLLRLRNEGYSLRVQSGFLLIEDVPYVKSDRAIARGTLVSQLDLAGNKTARPGSHVIHFQGDQPCDRDGRPIPQIVHAVRDQNLAEGVFINRSFSNKPADGYSDYYQKVTRYIEIISAPAHSLDETVTARTYRPVKEEEEESVFEYVDTNSSRAEIGVISAKLKGQKVAIIGLGGTGSYILDLMAKTPVREIHLFDADVFLQHNAFRAPGAASLEELKRQPKKVEYLAGRYANMHRHIIAHPEYIDDSNLDALAPMSFVFICMDTGPAKRRLVAYLLEHSVAFTDVGIGVNVVDQALSGTVRLTTGTPSRRDHLEKRIGFGEEMPNEYETNIQIAELNMLNASLAVIQWKKLCGFYADDVREYHSTYTVAANMLLGE